MTSKIMHVSGYDELKKCILEQENNGKKRIFILCSGSKDSSGASWCPDCVKAEPVVIASASRCLKGDDSAIFIECSVGDRPTWKDPACPFRTDPKLKLTGVPTLICWGKSKRLVEDQLYNESVVDMLFEDDD